MSWNLLAELIKVAVYLRFLGSANNSEYALESKACKVNPYVYPGYSCSIFSKGPSTFVLGGAGLLLVEGVPSSAFGVLGFDVFNDACCAGFGV